jgi:hypothetical protein
VRIALASKSLSAAAPQRQGGRGRDALVKPRNRKGYMPSPMLARAVKEAQRRGVPIEEQIVAGGERERA